MSASSPTLLRVFPPAVLLAGFALSASRLIFSTDEAWIDARIARNWAAGHGPTFHPDGPVVEAWTSPLFGLLGALAEAAGVETMPLWQGLGLGCGALLLLLLHRSAVALGVRPWVAWGATLSLALSPLLGAWSTGLPALVPGTLALVWLFDRLMRGTGPRGATEAALATAAVIGLRHDGPLWVGALLLAVGGWQLAEQRQRDLPLPRAFRPGAGPWVQPWLAAAVTWVGLFGALTTWRVLTFGDPLPWVLRMALPLRPVDGLWTLGAWSLGLGLPLLWLGLAALPSARRGPSAPVLGLFLLGLAVVVLGGRDTRPFAPGLLPAAAFGTVVLARFAEGERARGYPGTALSLLLAGSVLGALPHVDIPIGPRRVRQAADLRPDTARTRTEVAQWRFTRGNSLEGLALGRAVARHVPPGTTWSVGSPGARGYASMLPLIDLSGRTDPTTWALRRGDRARRADLADPPDLLRARLTRDEGTADVLVLDWAAEPDTAARALPLQGGRWLILQERVPAGGLR